MIQLQAAMGLGLVLAGIGIILVAVVFPTVLIAVALHTIQKRKKRGHTLDWELYSIAILHGLGFGLLTVVGAALLVVTLLCFVDLSIS